ncbi:MAG: VOC family protein [Saprospiraceae bacterium]|nr:VOC family protein [Saprospiraceae bacterium]
MQKIIPNLWFDGNAKEAAEYYLTIFKDGKLIHITYYPMTEDEGLADFQKDFAGKVLTVEYPETFLKRFCSIQKVWLN